MKLGIKTKYTPNVSSAFMPYVIGKYQNAL